MRPLTDLSDAELEAIAAGDTGAFTRATAQRQGVRPELVGAVMHQESRGNQNAVSPKGARGRMQLMPTTAAELGVDPDDEFQNIEGGVRYLGRQIKDFGDETKGLAAYNAGPGAVRKYGGVPPYAETQGYVKAIQGGAPDIASASDDELMRAAGEAGAPERISTSANGGVTVDRIPQKPPQMAAQPARADQGLGFLKGVATPVFNASGHLQRAVEGSAVGDSMASQGAVIRGLIPEGLTSFIDNPQGFFDKQAEGGKRPGKLGEFAGNVAATSLIPGGPLVQGAVGGALMSDKKDLAGVAGDAALGGAVGRLTALGSDALQLGARKVMSKVPQVMDLPTLETAKRAAYDAVDNSGFVFPKGKIAGLVDDFTKSMGSSALSKSAKQDAESIITYARSLTKSDVSLSQLEKLRGDIYTALVKKGGDTAVVGGQFRSKIDDLMGSVDDSLVKTARELNARFKKTDYVTRMSKSADRAAERTYGGDYGRKVKDRLNPLVDEAMPQRNLRGATPDEKAALEKVIRGTKGQNLASTLGGMLDPRRMGGKILSGITTTGGGASAPLTGGASLLVPALQMAAGFGLTGAASKTARKNVDELIRLMAAGGSKQALAPVPTRASQAAETAIAKVLRPALVASAVPAIAAARPPQKTRPKK